MSVAKIAVSLPPALLQRVERLRRKRKTTRSAVVAEALELLVSMESEQEKVRRYVESYRSDPERWEDMGDVWSAGLKTLAGVQW